MVCMGNAVRIETFEFQATNLKRDIFRHFGSMAIPQSSRGGFQTRPYKTDWIYSLSRLTLVACRNNDDWQSNTTWCATAHTYVQYIAHAVYFHVFLQEAL